MPRPEVIFFGNGPLADATLSVLRQSCEILFHARSKADLTEVVEVKKQHPAAFGVLASFGVIIRQDLLDLFESTGGIINIHPSLLPRYRGPSPIESAILAGDTQFGVSVMKLSAGMDAGDIYFQEVVPDLPLDKFAIYQGLAAAGAEWLVQHLEQLPTPVPQDNSAATFTHKLDKTMSFLDPEHDTAAQTLRKIIAYQKYPKPKYTFYGVECVILAAHLADSDESPLLFLDCADGKIAIDRLQPASKKPMDALGFINGYKK